MSEYGEKFWNSRNQQYPFHVRTEKELRKPERLGKEFFHFISVPIGDSVYWGFDREEARDKFLAEIGGEKWNA